MKKQLTTSVRTAHINHGVDCFEMVVIGEVFYTRRTRILKRLVRKIIYKVEISLDYHSIEEAKEEVRQQMDDFVKQYYNE